MTHVIGAGLCLRHSIKGTTFLASADVSCGAARSAVMPERLDPASRMLLLPGRMLSYVALLLCMFCAALLPSYRMLT